MKETQRQVEKLGKSLKVSLLQTEQPADNGVGKQAEAARKLFDSKVAKAQKDFEKQMKEAQHESQKQDDAKTKAHNDFMKETQRQVEKLGQSLKLSLLETEQPADNSVGKQA